MWQLGLKPSFPRFWLLCQVLVATVTGNKVQAGLWEARAHTGWVGVLECWGATARKQEKRRQMSFHKNNTFRKVKGGGCYYENKRRGMVLRDNEF